MVEVRCGQCNLIIDESPDIKVEQRVPCPNCHSLSRAFKVELQDEIKVFDQLKTKVKSPGNKRPTYESIHGEEVSHSNPANVIKDRIIDRKNDRYYERITDTETGKTIHECEEPLSNHIGHGDDKSKG